MNNKMLLGPWVRRFLLEYAVSERNLAHNTQRSYRDTLSLLITFIAQKSGKQVERLTVVDVSAEFVRLFLMDLEKTRGCSVATRNQRLAAIHALARFIGIHSPEHIEWCGQIRGIAFKKTAKPVVTYLEKIEMDALLAAPDRTTAQGRRDYVVMLFLYNTGARAGEAAQLKVSDLDLSYTPERYQSSVEIRGKSNKLRRCPLWPQTVSELALLVKGRSSSERLFLNRCGRPLTRFRHSHDDRTLCEEGVGSNTFLARKARESAYGTPYHSDASVARRCRYQYHPRMVGPRFAKHHQHICRG